jgi:hypothetical protein
MDVVILAGGKCSPELKVLAGTSDRCMIPIEGVPIIEIVKRATSFLGEPVIVGGPSGLGSRQVEAGENAIESLFNGMKLVKDDQFLLVTADLPSLSEESLRDFLARCEKRQAVFYYSILDVRNKDERFAEMKRTTIPLHEGVFTGGNVMLVNKPELERAERIILQAYEYRKKPFLLAKMIGFGTLLRIAISRIIPSLTRIEQLEKTISKFLTFPVVAIVSPYPELGADIDNAKQYQIFTKNLKRIKEVTNT